MIDAANKTALAAENLQAARPAPPRASRHPERGGSRIKAIIWLLIFASLIYVGIKFIPAYTNNYELEDKMREEARFAAVNRKQPDDVRADVYKTIQELGIPARKEDIVVEATDSGFMRITVNYTVTLDLKVYQWRLDFHPTADSNSV